MAALGVSVCKSLEDIKYYILLHTHYYMWLDPITLYNVLARLPMWMFHNVSDRSTLWVSGNFFKNCYREGEGGGYQVYMMSMIESYSLRV